MTWRELFRSQCWFCFFGFHLTNQVGVCVCCRRGALEAQSK